MMNAAQIRINQNPVLTGLLLGKAQGNFIAEKLFPRLPQTLSSVTLAKLDDERFKRYNLKRAPGTATKRIEINYAGTTYTIDQYSVEIPIARELIREADESRRLNVNGNLDISEIAMTTAHDVLTLDYEIDVSILATTSATYASGHVLALSGGTKWSAATGTPVTDILAAVNSIRKKLGRKPNTLALSADAYLALSTNAQVKSYLSSLQVGPASMDQLKTILNVPNIVVGEAVMQDASGVGSDVWGNNAILAYVPSIGGSGANISLAEPAFGFTNVMEGHPYAESPYFDNSTKSWIYGATYERRPNIAYNTAGFLFQNPN